MSSKGRPKEAKAREYATGEVVLSRCVVCGSTDRGPYEKPEEFESIGEDKNGNPYNVVIWRSCQCTNCGQWRRDQSHELRGTGAESPPLTPSQTSERN